MNKEKPHFRVDSSILKDTGCFRKYYLKGYLGYSSDRTEQSLAFGSAAHVFIEQYLLERSKRGGGPLEEIEIAKCTGAALKYYTESNYLPDYNKKYQDLSYLNKVCMEFDNTYSNSEPWKSEMTLVESPVTGLPFVEKNFSLPYYESEYCKISLTGTMDTLYKLRGKGIYIVNDWKTTTARDEQEFYRSFELSHQLLTYYFALSLFADSKELNPELSTLYKDVVYETGVGFTISPIFMKGATVPPRLERSPIMFFDKEDLEEYKIGLDIFCGKIDYYCVQKKALEEIVEFPLPFREGLHNGACVGAYGKLCSYFGACKSNLKGRDLQYYLDNHFTKRGYNPLLFRK